MVGKTSHAVLNKLLFLLLVFNATRTAHSQAPSPTASKTPFTLKDPLPYRQAPVDYFSPPFNDRMSRLVEQLSESRNLTVVTQNADFGYLVSLLKHLRIPIGSQLLVFSKTALNPHLVTPQNPRAIYFNDDTYVGWIPGAPTIEIVSTDPLKGGVFYTARQPSAESADKQSNSVPADTLFRRENRCLTCHVSSRTLRVPGLLNQSYMTDKGGKPLHGYSTVTLSTDWNNHFAGWFVTQAGTFPHDGNQVEDDGQRQSINDGQDNFVNITRIRDLYPATSSDIVAHLVFEHQVRFHNLLTRVIHESAFERKSDALDRLCDEVLFIGQADFPVPIQPTTFAREYQDKKSHSRRKIALRKLNLKNRLYDARVSPLIGSELFDRVNQDIRDSVLERLWQTIHDDDRVTLTQPESETLIQHIRDHVDRLPKIWWPL